MNPCNPFSQNCYNHQCCRQRNYCNNLIPGPQGPKGPPGTSATIAIGTTTTGAPNTNALVTNSGTSSNAVLNFTIPRGVTGNNGQSATIEIGTTTTLPVGSDATVTNSGTPTNAILNFGIPQSPIAEISSGSFISRNEQTLTSNNSIINLPIILNNNEISINQNSVITIPSNGRYLINYGLSSSTTDNIFGLYINGINNINTNLETRINNLNPSSSVILNLNANDTLTLGVINATPNNPLTLEPNTINAYITLISLQ